ncbi:LOW QUALITY PROTEIN: poly(A)-specific ribonuclease PARN-like [Homalodisca vitripennis]|uniref:LOW QUALITY PROTEIN: poly(A)-specific ribonuclease PARN-like n=1 Tax=Homalodisca vitripennis TaxID=197043 RepID=UPI001EEBD0B2|nr:LOW QUALITY PROTEIN: poly(A)-specific ribonuclease PARN-like [Homalodisca vitripennis]
MEVTRTNFRKVLPEIEDTINRCVFMAIDGEFTGLSSGLEKAVSAFDTPAEYYHKIKNGSLDFLLVQFGLVAFMYNEEQKKYTHRAYNFYLFPKPLSRQAPDCRFLCQASSLDFLASHGFNFNKLFNEGIPYLNKKDETTMRTKLDEARERRKSIGEKNNSFVECPAEHVDAVKKAVNSITEFLSTTHGPVELTLPPTNGFIRKLIYQEVWKRYSNDDLRIETKNGIIVVKRPATVEEKAEEEKKKLEDEESELDEAIGFSNVIRLISHSRKLVVGHNMLLDLCHVLHRFCEPLPDSYREFKELLHTVFPYILDTKFMCSIAPLNEAVPSSVLSHLLATVSQQPFQLLEVEPEGEHAYTTLEEKEHEAGFDAYITGTIAIALSNHLAKSKKVKSAMKLPSATSPHLGSVINRLYLMKVIDCYIDLEKDDPEQNRDAVFHVTFPEEWKLSDLTSMFSPYGGVYVSWIDSRTAYCGLHDKAQAVNVMKQLVPSVPAGVTVATYYAVHNLGTASPVKRRSGGEENGNRPKRKHSLSQESSLKRPSVDPIPEESEDSEKDTQTKEHPRKKRKVSKSPTDDTRHKLFEENLDW